MSEEPGNNILKVEDLELTVQQRLGTEDRELAELATNLLLGAINNHLAQGDQIAFLHNNSDGSLGLTTLTLDQVDED